MIQSTIKVNSARSGYGSATSGAYYWDMPTTIVVGLATGETALNQTRLTFPSLMQALGGGKAISVSSLKLGLTQVSDATDGMSRTDPVTAQFTTMSDWNVAYDIAAEVGINGETEITVPSTAAWLLETYTGNVFVHLKATDGPRASFAGWNTGDSAPYLKVLWDYAENTIHTDTVEATAGVTSVTWTITPGADDARYVLAYRLGTATGTVYDGSGTSITWTPPYSVAEGIPDAASGQMELTLAVYDSDGALLRQETTYLAINTRAARNVKFRTLSYDGSEPVVMDGLVTYYLGGETEMKVGITLTDTYADGATPVSVRFSLALDGWTSEAVWTASEMTKSGDEWTLPSKSMGIPPTGGTYAMSYTVTDTRGHVDSTSSLTLSIQDYARPSIPLFSAERYGEIIDDDQHVIGYQTDPTGNKVWFSASAAIASVGGVNAMTWVLTLTSRADGTVLTASGTATGTSLVWSDDRSLIGDTIDPEIVWDAALTVTDSAGFTATAYDVVPAGKAVLHLPACKNGIAFGGLSTATADNPLGEMFYPFHAYAGIYGVTGWSLKEEDTGGVWLDGQKVYRKTLYARIATAGQAVDIPFPDGLQRIVHMQGILYTDDTINRTRPLSWYYNASLNASLWHGGSANVTVQANGEIGDAFVTIWYTKSAGIVIIQQPEDASVALGGTATFTVKALGSPTYQWQQSTPPTATVGPDELLHVTDALAAPVTALEAAVTPVQSGSGDPSPSNVRPISGWTGANVYVADEEPVLGEGRNLLSVNNTTITMPYTQTAHAITYTRGTDGWINVSSEAVVTTGNFITTLWGLDSESVRTNAVTLTVGSGSGIRITTQPGDVSVAPNESATLKVVASGENLSYQWEWTSDGVNWNTATSAAAKAASWTFTAGAHMNGRQYRCLIKSGSESVRTNAVTLTVGSGSGIRITTQPGDVSVAPNESVTLKVEARGENLSYQWEVSYDGGNSWVTATSAAAKAASWTFTAGAHMNGRQYRCLIKSGSGSGSERWLGAGTYTFTIENDGVLRDDTKIGIRVYGAGISGDGTGSETTARYFYETGVYTITATEHITNITVYYKSSSNGIAIDGKIRVKMENGDTSTGWCPAPEDLATPAMVSFGQTVYGGVLDARNGTLMVRPYYASYSGQTLVGPWVSSMDVYAAGTTPTTGAQVVDLGGTLTTVSVTPATVQTRTGNCYVWADTGDVAMTYYSKNGTPTWSDISGETANTLSVTASLEAAAKEYRCQLTEGSAAATSDAAGIVLQ